MNGKVKKHLATTGTILLIVCFGVLMGGHASGQEFTKAQQAVMQLERAQWECLKQCNKEAFNTFFHTGFVGYSTCPDRPMVRAQEDQNLSMQALDYYILTPVAVEIHGDIAVVDYTYECGGIPDSICSGKVTNVWKQQGNTWKLISSISR